MDANGIGAIAIGAFLLTAIIRGNGSQLATLLKGEGGFIKWSIAVGILWFIATRKDIGPIGPALITVVVLGVAIKLANDPTLLSGITGTWNALPTSTPGVAKTA